MNEIRLLFRLLFRGHGGHKKHPTGTHRGFEVNRKSTSGLRLHMEDALYEDTIEKVGYECDIDGCNTKPILDTKNATLCVNCGKTYGLENE